MILNHRLIRNLLLEIQLLRFKSLSELPTDATSSLSMGARGSFDKVLNCAFDLTTKKYHIFFKIRTC